ncbi:MAG: hypothetical protein NVS9B4_00330 [Candidatus Acidiferrum sp.]
MHKIQRMALPLLLASSVYGAPSLNLNGVINVIASVVPAIVLIGAFICVIGAVFAVFSFLGGNIMRGIVTLVGVLVGAMVLGFSQIWVSSLSGQGL